MDKPAPDWGLIEQQFCDGTATIRELAHRHRLSDTAIRKKAKETGWVRANLKSGSQCEPEFAPEAVTAAAALPADASSNVKLIERGRRIILALMSELEAVSENSSILLELSELLSGETEDEGAMQRVRALLEKVISLPARAQAAKNLASALAMLRDAAPGKKKEAEEAAKTAGQGSSWGDDLDGGARPN